LPVLDRSDKIPPMLALGRLSLVCAVVCALQGRAVAAPIAHAPTVPAQPTPTTPVATTQQPSPASTSTDASSTAVDRSLDGDGNEQVDEGNGKTYSALGLSGFYAALSIWAYFAWYHNTSELPEFEIGGDGSFGKETYAGGADKLGHFWINYALTRTTNHILMAGGWNRLPASIIAASLSWSFFAFVEVKDGFYYELSPGDMVGNTVGAVLGVVMDNVPQLDELIDLRLQYFPSPEYRDRLINDGDVDVAEDYSGQTYMLALHLKSLPEITEPRWMQWAKYLDVVAGFESRNYKPEPTDEDKIRRQSLFVGVSLNLQHVLDELVGGPPRSVGHKIGHTIFEMYSPPYTTLRLGESTRHPDGALAPVSN